MTDNLFFIDEDEVLAHHGVKGMKWGVRKQRAASGGAGSTKKRKGLSRKQKAAIAGVLGTAAAAGAGYYLHKSGNGKKIAALAKKHGASAKSYAQGKGRNLGAQARANAKSAAEKLKTTKAGKYAEATRLAANAAAFKTGHAARSAGFRAKQGAWKVGNKARRAATGGVSGAKSAAGMAARSAKSKAGAAASAARAAARSAKSKAGAAASAARAAAGSAKSKVGAAAGGAAKSTASAKTPGKALQVSSRAVGYRKLHTTGTKVVRPKGAAADKLVKASVAGLATGVGVDALQYAALKAMSGGKKKRGRSRKRRR